MRAWAWIILGAALGAATARADLSAAKAEPNLEKRSDKALENASLALDAARKAWQDGTGEAFTAALAELKESVELSYHSLRQTGKNPSKQPKYFKRAELKMRELMRRMEGLKQDVDYTNRDPVEKVNLRIQELHEELLLDIMGRKR
jgi:hypothetical protein